MKNKSILIGGFVGLVLGFFSYYIFVMYIGRCWEGCEVKWIGNIINSLTPTISLIIFILVGGLIGIIIQKVKK